MDFFLQIIRLLSEPPASIIYHLVTLLALQVVFALSYSRRRRDDDDANAQRLMWAAAAIFLGRLLLLVVGLVNAREPAQAAALLPPLEQAVNTATAALMVWSLIPPPKRWPRLWDVLLLLVMVLIGVFFLFSAQSWREQIEAGLSAFASTPQNVIWTIFQIVLLAGGLSFSLVTARAKEALPAVILAILLLAAILHLWTYFDTIPIDTNVAYWLRLGYLIALPLWAVYAYQYYLSPLLASEQTYEASVARFGETLGRASEVIATRQRERRIAKSLEMATYLLEAEFASIGLVDHRNEQRINFSSNITNASTPAIKQWALDLSRHPTLKAAFKQGQTIELLPTGLGARQVHDFYGAFGSDPQGPLLIHPLVDDVTHFGLLVVAARRGLEEWTVEQKQLMPGLAKYISQSVANSAVPAPSYAAVTPPPARREVTETVPSAIFLDQVRLNSLQAERDELRAELEEAIERRKKAEEKALVTQKQARYLAAALRAAQSRQQEDELAANAPDTSNSAAPDVHSPDQSNQA